MENLTESNLFKSQNLSTIQSPDNFTNLKTAELFSHLSYTTQIDDKKNVEGNNDLELPENILKIITSQSNERSQA